MVTDCLAPVVMRRGVGTLVTSHKSECLGKDLKFYYTENETYLTAPKDPYWAVTVYNYMIKYRNSRVTYLSNEAMLLTPEGWSPINKLFNALTANVGKQRTVMGLKFRCVICNKPYSPTRPIQSTCSMECGRYMKKGKVLGFKPINEKSTQQAILEDWLVVTSLRPVQVPSGVEAVRVTKVEGSDSIYINGLLLSSQSLQNAL